MQFHLNGFRAGDPLVKEAATDVEGAIDNDGLPESVDVLIVGSGPAGLTLAAQLAAFPDISTRLIEAKAGPLALGQADGVACRTMEMFAAFGFAEQIEQEAYWVNEVAFWKPDAQRPEHIERNGIVQDTEDGLSEFPHVILNQARVHDRYLEHMRNSPSRMEVDYSRSVVSVTPSKNDGSAVVEIERTDPDHSGQTERVTARYVVGCDGARSVVRKSIGRVLHGDSANQAWGVMDVLAVSDFPDIRRKSAIQSSSEGNVLIIPREGGYLVRFYVEMDKLTENERVASKKITVEHVIAAAQRIMKPFTLEVKDVVWWSVYEIGQRICDKYDNVFESGPERPLPSIFIAGDACHTHSPKAGQGMNFSMQDTFNLGWKLAAVLRGQAIPELLHTYSEERQVVAQDMIDFDREWAKMFSDRPKDSASGEGVDPKAFQQYFVKKGRFTAGTETHYRPSMIRGADTWQNLAQGFVIGMRLHSAPVIRQADAKPMHLGHVARADGRWRLYAFAGANDLGSGAFSAIQNLCDFLTTASESPLKQYTSKFADIDAVFDCRVIFQQSHCDVAEQDLSLLFRPRKGKFGLIDYEKVFCPDLKSGLDIFDLRNIDREQGCLVVVRPDQHIAHVLPLTAHTELAAFFDAFMIRESDQN
ncbi:FAD-binding monooxygenase [Reinekea forsetii]|uniref:FAD-binding monooxygenase n=1 Tax=Reinekea forsetii TaxID=1336806 RepID=UPI0023553FB1|nr:FAD-binding monooxygenase [Reinekea forsetii]